MDLPEPKVGEEMNGMVWDGKEWIEKREWLLRELPKE